MQHNVCCKNGTIFWDQVGTTFWDATEDFSIFLGQRSSEGTSQPEVANFTNYLNYRAARTKSLYSTYGPKALHEQALLNSGNSTAQVNYFNHQTAPRKLNQSVQSPPPSSFLTIGYGASESEGPLSALCESCSLEYESHHMLREVFELTSKGTLKLNSRAIVHKTHVPVPLASLSVSSENLLISPFMTGLPLIVCLFLKFAIKKIK